MAVANKNFKARLKPRRSGVVETGTTAVGFTSFMGRIGIYDNDNNGALVRAATQRCLRISESHPCLDATAASKQVTPS